MWRVSQAVKTLGFHPRNKGSTPLPATKGVRLNGLGRYPLKVIMRVRCSYSLYVADNKSWWHW